MKTKTIVPIVLLILVILAIGWYMMSGSIKPQQVMQNNGDTTADISADLQQIPSDSSVNGELNSLEQDVQGF